MELSTLTIELTQRQFEKISSLVYDLCGINLHIGKKELVKARLNKRLRQLGISDFDEYLAFLASDTSGRELVDMLDAISTNLTSFFREPAHFEYLSKQILPRLVQERGRDPGRRLRIWSAGCSSGEEPYTIAIVLRNEIENLDRWDAAILATDINTRMLDTARCGEYAEARLKNMPVQVQSRCFECIESKKPRVYRARPEIRRLVSFARLNLLDNWPMRGNFDVIFCRNTMIYFDKPTQGKLVRRFREKLNEGGVLFIGHSESLTGIKHDFDYVQPTVYRRA
ncbi:MAG: protein-glutamate O-methyltransferase [Planctomycetota bacterium]